VEHPGPGESRSMLRARLLGRCGGHRASCTRRTCGATQAMAIRSLGQLRRHRQRRRSRRVGRTPALLRNGPRLAPSGPFETRVPTRVLQGRDRQFRTPESNPDRPTWLGHRQHTASLSTKEVPGHGVPSLHDYPCSGWDARRSRPRYPQARGGPLERATAQGRLLRLWHQVRLPEAGRPVP
jgi:hypothetical protein